MAAVDKFTKFAEFFSKTVEIKDISKLCEIIILHQSEPFYTGDINWEIISSEYRKTYPNCDDKICQTIWEYIAYGETNLNKANTDNHLEERAYFYPWSAVDRFAANLDSSRDLCTSSIPPTSSTSFLSQRKKPINDNVKFALNETMEKSKSGGPTAILYDSTCTRALNSINKTRQDNTVNNANKKKRLRPKSQPTLSSVDSVAPTQPSTLMNALSATTPLLASASSSFISLQSADGNVSQSPTEALSTISESSAKRLKTPTNKTSIFKVPSTRPPSSLMSSTPIPSSSAVISSLQLSKFSPVSVSQSKAPPISSAMRSSESIKPPHTGKEQFAQIPSLLSNLSPPSPNLNTPQTSTPDSDSLTIVPRHNVRASAGPNQNQIVQVHIQHPIMTASSTTINSTSINQEQLLRQFLHHQQQLQSTQSQHSPTSLMQQYLQHRRSMAEALRAAASRNSNTSSHPIHSAMPSLPVLPPSTTSSSTFPHSRIDRAVTTSSTVKEDTKPNSTSNTVNQYRRSSSSSSSNSISTGTNKLAGKQSLSTMLHTTNPRQSNTSMPCYHAITAANTKSSFNMIANKNNSANAAIDNGDPNVHPIAPITSLQTISSLQSLRVQSQNNQRNCQQSLNFHPSESLNATSPPLSPPSHLNASTNQCVATMNQLLTLARIPSSSSVTDVPYQRGSPHPSSSNANSKGNACIHNKIHSQRSLVPVSTSQASPLLPAVPPKAPVTTSSHSRLPPITLTTTSNSLPTCILSTASLTGQLTTSSHSLLHPAPQTSHLTQQSYLSPISPTVPLTTASHSLVHPASPTGQLTTALKSLVTPVPPTAQLTVASNSSSPHEPPAHKYVPIVEPALPLIAAVEQSSTTPVVNPLVALLPAGAISIETLPLSIDDIKTQVASVPGSDVISLHDVPLPLIKLAPQNSSMYGD